MSAWGSWDEMTQLMKYLQRRHAAIHSSTSTSMFTSHILTSHSTHQVSPFTFHMSPLPTPFGTCSPLLFRCQCLECRFALEGTNLRQQYPTASGFLTEKFTHIPVEWKLTGKRRKVPIRRNVLLSLRRSLSQLFSASPKCVHGLASVASKKGKLMLHWQEPLPTRGLDFKSPACDEESSVLNGRT